MSRHHFLKLFRPLGLLILLTSGLACSRSAFFKSSPPPDMQLTLALSKPAYLPGEPVQAMLMLTNVSGAGIMAATLDHASVTFSVTPQLKTGPGELHFVEPVFSEKEQTGGAMLLEPQGSTSSTIQRRFFFTTLTFERGDYILEAVYARPSGSGSKPAIKTYARAVTFSVAGDKVFAHRYLGEGLLARQDAIALAVVAAGVTGKTGTSDSLLITDEMGYKRWWINLTITGGETPVVKSYFVDPYFARVWREAQPFTAADKGQAAPMQPESKVIEQLKQQSIQKRGNEKRVK